MVPGTRSGSAYNSGGVLHCGPEQRASIGFSTGLQFPKSRDKGVVSVDPQGAAQSLHKKHDHHGVKYKNWSLALSRVIRN